VLLVELGLHLLPVGDVRVLPDYGIYARIEAAFELPFTHLLGQWPGDAGRLGTHEGFPDGRSRDAERPADLVVAEIRLELEPQDLLGLSHGQSPLCHLLVTAPSLVAWQAVTVAPKGASLFASTGIHAKPITPIPGPGRKLIGMAWNGRSPWNGSADRHGVDYLIGITWNR